MAMGAYTTVNHFMYVPQDKQFIVNADHKPLVTALKSVSPDWTDCVFRTLDYLSKFALRLDHISGKSNVVADNLSHMISVVVEPIFLDPLDLS